jgi:hypothetical protein
MLKIMQILDTSIVVSFLKHLCRCYFPVEQRIEDMYRNSRTHKLISVFREKIKVCFRFSFLGRITDIKAQRHTIVLDNSRTFHCLIYFYKKLKNKIIFYLNTSKAAGLTKEAKEEFYILPVKTIGIIAVAAIIVNITISVILQRNISLWGWFLRALFLFTGISGLFCNAKWPVVKEGSIFLKRINRN